MCTRCYQRERRGLQPSSEPDYAPAGQGDRVSVRLDKATRALAQRAAKAAGMTETDWYRAAIVERLATAGRKPRRRPTARR